MEYLLAYLVFLISTVAAQATSTPTSYPTATSDPSLVQVALHYDPSKAAAGIFAGLFAIATFVILFRLFGKRAWWGLYLPIGTAFMSAGFVLRIVMTKYPNSEAIYIFSTLFILLAPTTYLAFNYVLYGRFVVNCIDRRHSLIRPERTARYFIISDVSTFLIQGTGGSFLTSKNPHTDKLGAYIIIAGLVLQTLSFGIFIALVYHAFRSLKRVGDVKNPFAEPWGMIFKLLFFTSAFFFLRCVYRTVELAQGFGQGYLATHEAFFYALDSLPLFLGIAAYTIFWPSKYLESSSIYRTKSDEMSSIVVPSSEASFTPYTA